MCDRRASVLSQLWVFSNLRYAENRSESRQAVELLQVRNRQYIQTREPTIDSDSRTDNRFGLAEPISRFRTIYFDACYYHAKNSKSCACHAPVSPQTLHPKLRPGLSSFCRF
jgi:hypothetical protein